MLFLGKVLKGSMIAETVFVTKWRISLRLGQVVVVFEMQMIPAVRVVAVHIAVCRQMGEVSAVPLHEMDGFGAFEQAWAACDPH
jgi:hypothetical protein